MLGPHEKICMNIEVITSFNSSYYQLIGSQCVRTWLKYWPEQLDLTCYVEEFSLPAHDRLNQISFDQFRPEYFEFQSSADKQVKKFAKKAWSFIHAMENSTADRIVWLDADVLSIAPLSLQLLEDILPNEVLSTHMGVTYTSAKNGDPGRWFVPETGFFAVNTRHAAFAQFRSEYKRHYVERDNQMLRRFYDNDVYGHVLEKLQAPSMDLCKDFTKAYKTPLPHTVLGEYIVHYKAKHSKHNFSLEN